MHPSSVSSSRYERYGTSWLFSQPICRQLKEDTKLGWHKHSLPWDTHKSWAQPQALGEANTLLPKKWQGQLVWRSEGKTCAPHKVLPLANREPDVLLPLAQLRGENLQKQVICLTLAWVITMINFLFFFDILNNTLLNNTNYFYFSHKTLKSFQSVWWNRGKTEVACEFLNLQVLDFGILIEEITAM